MTEPSDVRNLDQKQVAKALPQRTYKHSHPFSMWERGYPRDADIAELVENRKNFEKEFGIYKRIKFRVPLPLRYHNSFDHPEVYAGTKRAVIFICSNYDNLECGPLILGMREYKKLYHADAFTYLITFDNCTYLRRALRAANELIDIYNRNKGCLLASTQYGSEFRNRHSYTKEIND